MEGFNTAQNCRSVICVANQEIKTADDAARKILEEFVYIDKSEIKAKVKFGPLFEFEASEVSSYFNQGRHVAALQRVVEQATLAGDDLLLIAIDEADKCPVPLATLIRSINTHAEHEGVNNIRFILAGVSPYFQTMVAQDKGMGRFFYKTITLAPMSDVEAEELMDTKFQQIEDDCLERGEGLEIQRELPNIIIRLSGGHPHLLQWLGSHAVEGESEHPDGKLDTQDLGSALQRICYEDRAEVYNSILHTLELNDMLDSLMKVLEVARERCPTKINRRKAQRVASSQTLEWLVAHDVLTLASDKDYGLVDEFLRVRMALDRDRSDNRVEIHLLRDQRYSDDEYDDLDREL